MAFRNYVSRSGLKDVSFVTKAELSLLKDVGSPSRVGMTERAEEAEVESKAIGEKSVVKEVEDLEGEETNSGDMLPKVIAQTISRQTTTEAVAKRKKPPVKTPATKRSKTAKEAGKAVNDDAPEESGDNAPKDLSYGVFAETPEPPQCHRLMAMVAPKGWKKGLDKFGVTELAHLQSQSALQLAMVDNVLNTKARHVAHNLAKVHEQVESLKVQVSEREVEVESLKTELKKGIEESESMIAAKKEIEKLRLGMQSQTEEVVRLKDVEAKVTEKSNQVSVLEAQLGDANASNQELRERVTMLEAKCRDVVTRVLPHACLELVKSEELGVLIADYVNANRAEARSMLMEELAAERKIVLATRADYMPHAAQAIEAASEAILTASFPFVQELTANPDASVTELLAVKPRTLPKP